MKTYPISKLLVVFVITLLLLLPYAFAKKPPKPEPPEELSWSVYIPSDSYGIQGAGLTPTCETGISCPDGIPDGSYVYAGGTTENNARYHFLKFTAPFKDDARSEFDFMFPDDGVLRVKLGLYLDQCGDLDEWSSLDCILSSEQPNNFLTDLRFQFYSDWLFNFETQEIGELYSQPLIGAWFNFYGDPAFLYRVGGSKSEADDLTVTRISENGWHIEYNPVSESYFECRLHLMVDEVCVPINKNREECTYEYRNEGPYPYEIPAFDLYFVRE